MKVLTKMICFWVGVFSDQLQNHEGIFFVSVYIMSFVRLCPSWAITILQMFFIYLIINPLSSGRKHRSTYPQTLWDWYRSLTFPGVSLEFCNTLSVQTDVLCCQNSFWGSYRNWMWRWTHWASSDSSSPRRSSDCTFPVCYHGGIKENHGLGT